MPVIADRVLASNYTSPVIVHYPRAEFVLPVFVQQFEAEDHPIAVGIVSVQDIVSGVIAHRDGIGVEVEPCAVMRILCR